MDRAVPVLPVTDLRVAREFYVDQLGFQVRFEASEDGTTRLLGVARDTIALTLDCPMSGHGREACVALEVGDADAYHAEWQGRVPILRPPHEEPWGARTFDLLDPFGNTLFVIGPSTTARPSPAPDQKTPVGALHARSVFFVADADRSLRHYTEELGFALDWDSHDGVFQVSLLGFELILNQVGERTRARAGHGRVFIGLEDNQGEPLRRHIAEKGIQAFRVEWGRPTLVIRDVDGNQLFFWMPDDDFSNVGKPVIASSDIAEPTT